MIGSVSTACKGIPKTSHRTMAENFGVGVESKIQPLPSQHLALAEPPGLNVWVLTKHFGDFDLTPLFSWNDWQHISVSSDGSSFPRFTMEGHPASPQLPGLSLKKWSCAFAGLEARLGGNSWQQTSSRQQTEAHELRSLRGSHGTSLRARLRAGAWALRGPCHCHCRLPHTSQPTWRLHPRECAVPCPIQYVARTASQLASGSPTGARSLNPRTTVQISSPWPYVPTVADERGPGAGLILQHLSPGPGGLLGVTLLQLPPRSASRPVPSPDFFPDMLYPGP